MEFKNPEEAWAFWLSYAGQRGFEVRKRYTNKRPSDGKVTSCRFVCANEGHQLKDKRDRIIKCPRAETRTDCQVHMSLKMDRQNRKMKVNEPVLEHNHALHLPETLHLLVSQRKISDLQAFEIEMADDVGIGPKAAHELASHQEEERREERRKEKEEERRQEKKKNEDKNEEKDKEPSILSDFSACMFEYEDIREFEDKFDLMRQKVGKQTWLDSIYKLKEK